MENENCARLQCEKKRFRIADISECVEFFIHFIQTFVWTQWDGAMHSIHLLFCNQNLIDAGAWATTEWQVAILFLTFSYFSFNIFQAANIQIHIHFWFGLYALCIGLARRCQSHKIHEICSVILIFSVNKIYAEFISG